MKKTVICFVGTLLAANQAHAKFEINCIESQIASDGLKQTLSLVQNGESAEYEIKLIQESVHMVKGPTKTEQNLGKLDCKLHMAHFESSPPLYMLYNGTCERNDLNKDGVARTITLQQRDSFSYRIVSGLQTPGQMGVGAKKEVKELGSNFKCRVDYIPVLPSAAEESNTESSSAQQAR